MSDWLAPSRPAWRRLRTLLGSLSSLLLVHLAATGLPQVHGLFGIAEQRFKYEGLIDLGALGLDNADGMVAAVGDVEGDQILQLFVLSADQRKLSVYAWNREAYTFQLAQDTQPINAPFAITNVVPGDFDYDGRLDLLLMGEDNPGGWWSENELKMVFMRGLGKATFAEPISIHSSQLQQPIPLDAQGDMRTDLLGFPFGDDKNQNPKVWQNSWEESNQTEIFRLVEPPLDSASFNCKFPNPHSNAFIDLDGDCLADLFLVCQDSTQADRLSFQIWTNAKDAGFRLALTGSLPAGAGQVTFADMDRDGTIDMVFPSCTSEGCFINIAYNQQMPLCTTQAGLTTSNAPRTERCREATNLCVADSQFSFDLTPSDNNSAFQRIPFSKLLPASPYLMMRDSSFEGTLPVPLRIGDYNKDGYPDLLAIASTSSSPSQGQVSLLQSSECDKKTCSESQTKAGRRTFTRLTGDKAAALDKIKDAKSAMWFDIDEDGSLDILVQRAGKSGGASRQISFIMNNYYHDAFFLRTLVGNGACEGTCVSNNGTRYHPYGVSYSGASYKFTVLDTSGKRKATQVGQLAQASYMSLITPYSYFGLGRTNNYVENLFVGSTRHQDQHFISMEGLIPNSQVVIVPYQPEDGQTPVTWTRQLFLQPGKWIPWVGVTLVGSLIILFVIVIVLHVSEQRQDEAERRKAQHLINFDAL